jgi:hypothetical protein
MLWGWAGGLIAAGSTIILPDFGSFVIQSYDHVNPLSMVEPSWKEKGIKDPQAAIKFLEEYHWSSYLDYAGKKNFPSVTEREFALKCFGGVEAIKLHVTAWINHKKI